MTMAGKTIPVRRSRPFLRRALRGLCTISPVPLGRPPRLDDPDALLLPLGRPPRLDFPDAMLSGALRDTFDSRAARGDAGSVGSSMAVRFRDNAVLSVDPRPISLAAEQRCHNGSSLARNFTRKPVWGMLT